jgi:ABC-type nitrate/sulfonate/bicarbonate transport system substrate-binding protein
MGDSSRSDTHVWSGGDGLEKSRLTLGFIPLTDCAPLAIAAEKGFFKRHGLNVTLAREASWANIRDKVALNALDGAQMLAPMPIAATLGSCVVKQPTITAFSLGLNGNAITVSNSLYRRLCEADPEAMATSPITARALKKVIVENKRNGQAQLTFAMVFPVSNHNYQLRYWMASAGIDPDRDIRLIVIPPPHMVANLESGKIDGFCVGEPWNTRAVRMGIGRILISGYEIWNNSPEKVLGVKLSWAEKHPNTHRALIMALLEAGKWLDQNENREEAIQILASDRYINTPVEDIAPSLTGMLRYSQGDDPVKLEDFSVFYRYAANFPWRSHAEWIITQMYRWGQIDQLTDIQALASRIYRPDIYRDAAKALGISAPTIDHKPEGAHAEPWVLSDAVQSISMGSDQFFDAKQYDAADPLGYLKTFSVQHLAVDAAAELIR